MDRKLHLLESFTAQGPDGQTYKVFGYEHLVRDETFAGPDEHWEPTGVSEYRLADGRRVDLAASFRHHRAPPRGPRLG